MASKAALQASALALSKQKLEEDEAEQAEKQALSEAIWEEVAKVIPKDGQQGVQGEAGKDGVEGAVGEQGVQGERGSDGSVGPQGKPGVDGIVRIIREEVPPEENDFVTEEDLRQFAIKINDVLQRSGGSSVGIQDNLIETSEEGNSAVKVFIQDQTTDVIDLYFHEELNMTAVAVETAIDDITIELASGHGAVDGNFLEISEAQHVSQFEVLSVDADTITIDSPMDHVFTTAATIQISNVDMNVDGSTTPRVFQIDPIPGQEWDVTRVILAIESADNMDFSLFGSIPEIARGCVIRLVNGTTENLFNWKTNGDFINRSYDHIFQENVGQSVRGFTARTTFAGQSKRGVTLRLEGNKGDELQVIVQDDLTVAVNPITKMRMIVQGHEVQGD